MDDLDLRSFPVDSNQSSSGEDEEVVATAMTTITIIASYHNSHYHGKSQQIVVRACKTKPQHCSTSTNIDSSDNICAASWCASTQTLLNNNLLLTVHS